MSWIQNTRKPVGFGGKMMVRRMNHGSHEKLANWGIDHLSLTEGARILEAGCGGGANIRRLLQKCPSAHITGLDYSEVSVAESKKVNRDAISAGTCDVVQGDVGDLPFDKSSFDFITAFETIYFWTDPARAFAGIFNVLKPGGVFLICNESNGRDAAAVKFSQIIDGMKLYDKEDLRSLLSSAGFTRITCDEKEPWLCVTAARPAE